MLFLFSHSVVVSNSFVSPQTVAGQAPLPMKYPRQEYWSGLLFPSLGDLPDPAIQLASPALLGGLFTTDPPGKLREKSTTMKKKISALISFLKIQAGFLTSSHSYDTKLSLGLPKILGAFLGESQVNDQVTHHFYDPTE